MLGGGGKRLQCPFAAARTVAAGENGLATEQLGKDAPDGPDID